MQKFLPIFIIVFSNTFYHICTKSTPSTINTFASLTVTYAVGALASLLLFFLTQKKPDLLQEFGKLNWTSFVLGLSIVGLEAGTILMYKVGWDISTGQIVQGAILAVVLIFVGYLIYKEKITATKLIGIAVCMAGLYMINK